MPKNNLIDFLNLIMEGESEGPTLPEDLVDLREIPWEVWEEFECFAVALPDGVRRYLASGDRLTHKTLDHAEIAVERYHGVETPWYITSQRFGHEEDGSLRAGDFYLGKEC